MIANDELVLIANDELVLRAQLSHVGLYRLVLGYYIALTSICHALSVKSCHKFATSVKSIFLSQ